MQQFHRVFLGTIGALAVILHCQAADIFTVEPVVVEKTGETDARMAREKALVEGQVKAFKKVLGRIVPSYTEAMAASFDEEAITSCVQEMDIKEEKLGAHQYHGVIAIRFGPECVQGMLKHAEVAVVVQPIPPMLVLPVYNDGNHILLMEETNPWRKAWEKRLMASEGAVPLMLPSAQDLSFAPLFPVSVLQGGITFSEGQQAEMLRLAKQYGAEHVVVVEAMDRQDGVQPDIEVQLHFYGNSPAYQGKEEKYRFSGGEGASAGTLLDTAVVGVKKRIESIWQGSQQHAQAETMQVQVGVPVHNLQEWNMLRKQLSTLPFISRMDIRKMTSDAVLVDVYYRSPLHDFKALMSQEGFMLEEQGDALWLVGRV